ncbi:MAG: HAD-IA family hydrolase [Methylococcales bacterium]|nr:HAD-IA family hydrolase [Methylococcales bacterium]
MREQFDLIIFDWDGTLMDSIHWIVECLQYAASACNLPEPSDSAARDIIGLSIEAAMARLFPECPPATAEQLVHHYSQRFLERSLSPEDLFAGISDMLHTLKNHGFQLAVATGKSRRGLNRALRETETEHCFAATRCADETESKPAPRMLLELSQTLAVPVSRCVMVGDSVHDLAMAANAGMTGIGVSCGAHCAARLAEHQPWQCFAKTTDLMTLLNT